MFYKTRKPSQELVFLRLLHTRIPFTEEEANYYHYQEKGYSGEVEFDCMLETHPENWLILSDLLLEINNTTFQIDSLIITSDKCFIFDIKNNEGDYFVEKDRWYTLSKKEVKNHLLQLRRCETLFRQLLQINGYQSSIESQLIFINPEFFLYQAPLNEPIIFRPQLDRYLTNLKSKHWPKLTKRHYKLAEKLVELHMTDSRFVRVPGYSYEQVQKGIMCRACGNLVNEYNNNGIIVCGQCNCVEGIEVAVIRTVRELKLLFPDIVLTTNIIHDWCKVINSKQTIRNIMNRNFRFMKLGKSSYYEVTEHNHFLNEE